MKKLIALIAGIAALGMATLASAQDMSAMIGKWQWQAFTIEVTKGGQYGISAKVIAGPANVGMEMMQSAMKPMGNAIVARVKHPANGQIYNAKMTFDGADSWKMDGCTDAGACASGVFTRVK
ncbi:MAG TPA: hypothetical protein ENJ99_03795 [Rhizobiales bacterium]|nr:hypothetical protein [Hyphomicrobiales bacterium]